MNEYNDHIKESIDYFNNVLECRKRQVSNSDFQTTLRLAKEKTAYETAIESLKKQLPQPAVKATHKSILHENKGDKPHVWKEIECEVWECPCCKEMVWNGISARWKSRYCSNCGQKIDWKEDK